MTFKKVLEAINSISEYTSLSQNVDWEVIKTEKLQLTMSAVLAMKKIQSFEIEYFNKYGENGLACVAITLILKHPSSKIWAVLGKELVSLLKYWLDAMRKHLVNHNPDWWSFMEVIIKFIKEIHKKHSAIPDALVEQIAECLLDLSTNERSDEYQKLKLLQCLNMFCADSSREIRFAMRNNFSDYFVKLSTYLSTCGHIPCQLFIMETLLRWLVPRQNRDVRTSSANKWFPRGLYSQRVVDIFLERPWADFFKDARDFLNTHNEANNLIFSLICRKLSIGAVEIISGTQNRNLWLDINLKTCCMSVFFDPEMLDRFGVENHKACEVLIISEESASIVQLYSESRLIVISVTTLSTPQVFPSSIKIADEGIRCLQFVVSSDCDLRMLDKGLRKIYGEKYRLLMDLNREHTLSPQQTSHSEMSRHTDQVKFSQPVGKQRGRRSGYVLRSKNPVSYHSPSTTSTKSLPYLHNRLAAFPKLRYNKKVGRVCESPNLTKVTETSETNERQTLNSVTELKLTTNRGYGVSYKSIHESHMRNSQKDIQFKTDEADKSLNRTKDYSPSCLLTATIGSTDESIISNTIERLSKKKEYNPDNVVDLLIQEALNNDREIDTVVYNNSNKDANKDLQCIDENSKAIVNTEFTEVEVGREKRNKKNCEVRNNSFSTDDSNANIINNTPANYVTFRKNYFHRRTKPVNNVINVDVVHEETCDAEIVKNFFKQHFVENSACNIGKSLRRAMEINETSPQTIESYGDIINELSSQNIDFMLDDVDISECLNSIVDKVCNDLQKKSEHLSPKNTRLIEKSKVTNYDVGITHVKESSQNLENKHSALNVEQNKIKNNNNLQLRYPVELKNKISIKTRNATKNYKNKKDENNTMAIEHDVTVSNDDFKEPAKKKIKGKTSRKKKPNAKHTNNQVNNNDDTGEQNLEGNAESSIINETISQEKESKSSRSLASSNRRKRKLYSPIMEQTNKDCSDKQTSDVDENVFPSKLKYKSKMVNSNAVSYKDIEQERRNYIRRPRNLRSKSKGETIQSLRDQKLNEAFDKLKETIENNNNEILVDVNSTNMDVYNYTSESEDDDFKRKKVYTRKLTSGTGSIESLLPTTSEGVTRQHNYTQNTSNTKNNSNKTTKANKVAKKRIYKRKISIPVVDLVDERMRQSHTDVLNTSLVIEQPKKVGNYVPVPLLKDTPQLEDYNINDKEIADKDNKHIIKNKENKLPIKNNEIDHRKLSDDRTESPLPELVVETTTIAKDNVCDSIQPNMLESFKKIYMNSVDVSLNETNTTQNQLLGLKKNYQNEQSFNYKNQRNKNVTNISKRESLNISINNTKLTKTYQKSDELKYFPASDRDEQEIIEIPGFISEKSIATVGIPAHGDFNESPPGMNCINQQVSPRNLEIEDFDKPLQDYFNQLEYKLNQSNENNQFSKLDQYEHRTKSPQNKVEKIPYVSLSRLSSDDLKNAVNSDGSLSKLSLKSGGIPQPRERSRSSDKQNTSLVIIPRIKSTSDKRSPDHPAKTKRNIETRRYTNVNKNVTNSSTASEKSFIIKFNKHRWLPSSRNSESDFEDNTRNVVTRSSSIRSKTDKDFSTQQKKAYKTKSSTAELNQSKLKLIFNTSDTPKHVNTNTVDSNKFEGCDIDSHITRQTKLAEVKQNAPINKKSVISPIKMDLLTKCQTQPSQIIKDGVKQTTNVPQNLNTHKSIDTSKVTPSRHIPTESRHLEGNRDILHDGSSSGQSKASSEVIRMKLKRTKPIVNDLKSKKIMFTIPSVSDRSVSNVNSWFERNDTASNKDEDATRVSMVDALLDISEKLSTTYTEMNTNTNRRLVQMFVEIQRQSETLDNERRTMYSETIKEMMEKISNMLHVMITDLDNKSKNMTVDFMKHIRESTSIILVQDSRQRQTALQMLQEDIATVVNLLQKK